MLTNTQMQCLRDEEALVPQPRGILPKVCGALTAIASMLLVCVLAERPYDVVAMAIVKLTLGPLLYGICLLAEELLYHRTTRYKGHGLAHILPACGIGGWTLLAFVAGCCLLSGERECWTILLASAFYPLFKTMGVLGPSEVEVSEMCEGRKMNVAHGLAWSFYLGYLQLLLPRIEDSIATFRDSHPDGPFQARGSRKLVILIPLNANIAHKLEDLDDRIRFFDNLPNTEIDRAGVRGRVYKHSVYSVLDENGKAHECVVECATPLLTLYRMSQESSAGFGEAERRQQVLLFYRTLQDILDGSLDCRNRYQLILLNDQHEEDSHLLSKTILRNLNQLEKEEFCLEAPPQQESHRPRQNPELMSRDPTLMFSSIDRPQPLREAVECTDYH